MKKNLLNKFLYFGFKFGKVFAVVALIVLFLTMIGSTLYLLKTGNYKISTPEFSVVKQKIEAEESYESYSDENTVSTNVLLKEKTEKRFSKEIEKIIFECKLKPFAYDMILRRIMKYDEKYQKQYVSGLQKFISEGLEFIKEKYHPDLSSTKSAKRALDGILDEYDLMFSSEIARIKEEQQEQLEGKIVAGSVLGIAILLFVICLFLPLLIKIEENTREFLELNKEKNND